MRRRSRRERRWRRRRRSGRRRKRRTPCDFTRDIWNFSRCCKTFIHVFHDFWQNCKRRCAEPWLRNTGPIHRGALTGFTG
jgi:hypothetical protein